MRLFSTVSSTRRCYFRPKVHINGALVERKGLWNRESGHNLHYSFAVVLVQRHPRSRGRKFECAHDDRDLFLHARPSKYTSEDKRFWYARLIHSYSVQPLTLQWCWRRRPLSIIIVVLMDLESACSMLAKTYLDPRAAWKWSLVGLKIEPSFHAFRVHELLSGLESELLVFCLKNASLIYCKRHGFIVILGFLSWLSQKFKAPLRHYTTLPHAYLN